MHAGLALALAALLTGAACAKKAPSCEVPAILPHAMLEGPKGDEPRRLLPIGGYSLALSWSPEFCSGRASSPQDRLQCGGALGSFGFVLHGLWPDGEGAEWPQYCVPTRLVPEKVIREQLCSMPSVQLIQHEWEKHGTCMAKTPEDYFAKARQLQAGVNIPDMAKLRGSTTTVAAFSAAFAGANAGMRPDQIKLMLNKDGRLRDVIVCLDRGFRRRTCPIDPRAPDADALVRIRS